MIEVGTIKEIYGNKAKVQIKKHSACKKCGVCKYDVDEKLVIAEAENAAGAKIGDEVEVQMDFDVLLSASLIAYIIPITVFIIGCVIGFYLISDNNPIVSFAAGLVFIAGAYVVIKFFDRKGKFKKKYSMKITKIISEK
jgi:sigma-E factor negative regulatory protein RseC